MNGLRRGEKHGTKSECSVCGELFCGVRPLDDHRVGEHGVNRHCLTAAEMLARGFSKCPLGRWGSPSGSATRPRTDEDVLEAVS